mgnify:CR=1 FL=1
MYKVYGKGEVEDELGAGYKKENEYGTVTCQHRVSVDDGCRLPSETVQYPDEAQGPAHCGVAAQRLPVEYQI